MTNWHVSGPHFRDHHLLLDEQATQIFGTTDTIAEHANETARRHGSDG
jgi:starvation-inducible DNA-binding protein